MDFYLTTSASTFAMYIEVYVIILIKNALQNKIVRMHASLRSPKGFCKIQKCSSFISSNLSSTYQTSAFAI